MKIDHFGFLAPFYEFIIKPKRPEKLLALLNIPVNSFVLDVGGGTGRVAQFLFGETIQVIIADPSFKMLEEAQKKNDLQPVCGLSEFLPFADNTFDRIIMVDALHHVANQAVTINELWRILKSGGRLIIEEPDIRLFRVKLIAFAEKLALMRSHFLSPLQIAHLFDFHNANVKFSFEDSTAWIIVEKN
jgi:ubiquinone/menaquinone biosynthesis C-methylase UbiE